MVAGDAKTAIVFSLSPGHAGDAPEGRTLLKTLENKGLEGINVIMDRAYEDDETLSFALNASYHALIHKCSNLCPSPTTLVLELANTLAITDLTHPASQYLTHVILLNLAV